MKAYKEVLKERDLERTQLKADVMTLETKLKASQEECVRKEKDAQRQFRSMENNFGEQLRAMNQTRDKCKEFERSCSQLEMVRGTLERRVTALGEENEQLQARLDAAERKEMELMRQRNEAEGRVKEGEAELKSRVTQLQQEVARRAQQVGGSQIRVWGVWCCHSGWGRGICTVHMALCTYTPTYMGLEGEQHFTLSRMLSHKYYSHLYVQSDLAQTRSSHFVLRGRKWGWLRTSNSVPYRMFDNNHWILLGHSVFLTMYSMHCPALHHLSCVVCLSHCFLHNVCCCCMHTVHSHSSPVSV